MEELYPEATAALAEPFEDQALFDQEVIGEDDELMLTHAFLHETFRAYHGKE